MSTAPVLRPYQADGIEAVREVIRAGARRVLICAPVGSGKTVVAASIIRSAFDLGTRTLFLAHRKELLDQAVDKLQASGIPEREIGVIRANDRRRRPGAHVQVASVDTQRNRPLPQVGLVFVDECFPAGTLVDGRGIASVRVGDLVRSVNHATGETELRTVTRLFRSQPHSMATIYFADGRRLTCTPGHPLFTARGYVAAANLVAGDLAVGGVNGDQPEDLRGVRDLLRAPFVDVVDDAHVLSSLQGRTTGGPRPSGDAAVQAVRDARDVPRARGGMACTDRDRVLLGHLQGGVDQPACRGGDGCDESALGERQDAREQSHASRGMPVEDVGDAASDRAHAQGARGEWAGRDRGAGDAGGRAGMGDGSRHPDENGARERLPHELQARHRGRDAEGCDRDRRIQSHGARPEGARQEEGRLLGVVRVDRIEIHERSGNGRFGGLCPDGHVYNLEVDGHHNYFANGFLVHNCHRALAKSYVDIAAKLPEAVHLGLTATPIRADGKGLADAYDELVMLARIPDLISDGYLVQPRVWSVPDRSLPDLRGVKSTGGDYNAKQLAERVDSAALVGDIVEHYERRAEGERAFCFAVTVEHSRKIVARFCERGFAAEHLDGETPTADRDAIFARLRSGVTRIVSNVGVTTEGTDVPSVKCIILARPTQSLGLYLQMVGRCMRPFEGRGAIVLDHAGCARMHGLPHEDRPWSLEPPKRKRRASEVECAKSCPECFAVVALGVRICECGYVFPIRQVNLTESAGELEEVLATSVTQLEAWTAMVAAWREENERRMAKPTGRPRKPGWLRHAWKQAHGYDLPRGSKMPKLSPEEQARIDAIDGAAAAPGPTEEQRTDTARRLVEAKLAWREQPRKLVSGW